MGRVQVGSHVDELPSYLDEPETEPETPARRLGPPRPRAPKPGAAVPRPPPAGRRVDRQFVRVVDVPLTGAVATLSGVWSTGAAEGRSVVSGLRGPPVGLLPGGPVVLAVGLPRGLAPTLPMDLELGPWLLSGTRIELRPRGPVRASRRYFRAGHDLLDEVVSLLVGRR